MNQNETLAQPLRFTQQTVYTTIYNQPLILLMQAPVMVWRDLARVSLNAKTAKVP